MTLNPALVRSVLDRAWSPLGYTRPNPRIYPYRWLWDSCFHSIAWSWLGDDRAVTELASVFADQGQDGFVPHMGYGHAPQEALALWGRAGASTITQPPMYGHAIRVLVDRGFDPPEWLIEEALRGLRHLWRTRRRGDGLLAIVHPWETGCDDSQRWGSWMPEPFTKPVWDARKRALVDSLVVAPGGGAISNPAFEVASVAFNAIAAFNMLELAHVTVDSSLNSMAISLAAALGERWVDEPGTWADGDHASGRAPTLEGLLPLLVVPESDRTSQAWAHVLDSAVFNAPYGPRQTAATALGYDPEAYWRGPVWPQLAYLIWVAAQRAGRGRLAGRLARSSAAGAAKSRLSEYWHPETGRGLGAIPTSCATVAWVMLGAPAQERERSSQGGSGRTASVKGGRSRGRSE